MRIITILFLCDKNKITGAFTFIPFYRQLTDARGFKEMTNKDVR